MPDQRNVEFDFTGQAEQLIKTLDRIEKHIRRVPKDKKVDISVKTAEARKQIDTLEAEIRRLAAESPDVKVSLDLKRAALDVARARAMIATIPDKKVLTVTMRERVFGRLSNAARLTKTAVVGVETAITGVKKAAGAAEGATSFLRDAFGNMSTFLRRLGPLIMGMGIAITASLLPAILALGAGFVGAIGGATALAAALGNVLAPAILSLIGIFGRLTSVMDVFKLHQQTVEEQAKATADQTAAQTASEQGITAARRASADATRRVAQAEKALGEARRQARQSIVDAEQELRDSQTRMASASAALADAEVRSYQEIQDAIEAASDAVRDYEHAKLDAQQAELDLSSAQDELKNFRKELGVSGKQFDSLFQKFTNVNVDLDDLAGGLQKAGGAGEQLGRGKGLNDLKQLILNVQKAKLADKDATEAISDSTKDMNDTAREAADLQKKGVKGTETYKSALEDYHAAQKDVNESQRTYNKLLKQGIDGADGVVKAHENLADAIRNEKRQQQDLVQAQKAAADADTAAQTAMEEYTRKRNALSDAEQGFLDQIIAFSDTWKKMWKEASKPVFIALNQILGKFNEVLPKLQGIFNAIGQAWGDALKSFGQRITSPQFLLNMAGAVQALIPLIRNLGNIAGNLLLTFSNIGAAAMPALVALGDAVEKLTGRWAKNTSDIGKTRKTVMPMIEALKGFVGIITGAGEAAVAVFTSGSGPINDFIGWIRDGVKAFGKWAKSAKGGDKIKQFFEDTLPLAKSIIKFILKVGEVILKAFQFVAPVLKPFVDMFTLVAEIAAKILNLFLLIPAPVRGFAGEILALLFGFTKFTKGAKILYEVVGKAGGVFKLFGKVAKEFLNLGIKPFKDFWALLKNLFRGKPAEKALDNFAGAVESKVGSIVKTLSAPFRALWSRIRAAFRSGVSAIGRIFAGIGDVLGKVLEKLKGFVKPFSDFAQSIANGVKNAFRGLGNFVKSIFDRVLRVIKGAINLIVDSVNFVIRAINKIPNVKTPFGKVGIPDIPEIPHLAAGGVTRGGTLAEIGEAGREAVLPLNAAVYKELASGIVLAMQSVVKPLRTGGAAVAAAGGGVNIEHQTVILPPAPGHKQMGDARHQAVVFAREMSRRGGSSVGH